MMSTKDLTPTKSTVYTLSANEFARLDRSRCEKRECDIVKHIIETVLEKQSHVFKDFVICEIGYRVHSTRLFNKALEKHVATHNGVENLRRGAERVFLDAMRRLKDQYMVRKTGCIVRRNVVRPDGDGPTQQVQGGQS